MRPYYEQGAVTIYHGDCLDVLRELPDESFDSVVTDPPYGLGFMGKDWDAFGGRAMSEETRTRQLASNAGWTAKPYGASGKSAKPAVGEMAAFQTWCQAWAAECLRILKPGGHLLAFGGSRTWHRLASGVEDAGFEIRDSIAWLYGSGFPKSLDVSKAIDATHLQGGSNSRRLRATEQAGDGDPYTMTENNGIMGETVVVERKSWTPETDAAKAWEGWGTALKPAFEPIVVARKPLVGTVAGNVLAHGTGALNIDATRVNPGLRTPGGGGLAAKGSFASRDVQARYGYRPEGEPYPSEKGNAVAPHDAGRWPSNVVLDESQGEEIDRQSGISTSAAGPVTYSQQRSRPGASATVDADNDKGRREVVAQGFGDSGGAARYFPTFRYEPKAPTTERPTVDGVAHPTVKPLDLMRWLVRLVTPPNGVILEPFAGSGTTVEAAVLEGFRCVAIEREADYLPLIEKRLSKPMQQSLFGDWDEDGAA